MTGRMSLPDVRRRELAHELIRAGLRDDQNTIEHLTRIADLGPTDLWFLCAHLVGLATRLARWLSDGGPPSTTEEVLGVLLKEDLTLIKLGLGELEVPDAPT